MRVFHRMPLEDLAAQLRVVVETQPFSAQRELTIDLIDQITTPMDEDEIRDREGASYEAGEADGEHKGRIAQHHLTLSHFEDFGMAGEIGLTETQHEQILELLGDVKP